MKIALLAPPHSALSPNSGERGRVRGYFLSNLKSLDNNFKETIKETIEVFHYSSEMLLEARIG